MSEPTSTLPPEFAIKVLDHAPQGVLVSNSDGAIVWCNQTLADWLGASPAAIAGGSATSLLKQHFTIASKQEPDVLTVNSESDTPTH